MDPGNGRLMGKDRSGELMVQAALGAVKKWRYEPARQDGRALVAMLALPALVCLVACGPEPADAPPPENSGFTLLGADRTGLDFSNDLVENAEFNRLNYEYFYNGGGVAAGDLDGDGLVDLYFTGNQVPDRLYRNRGGLRFEDVSEKAGLLRAVDWHAGVAFADVNADGLLDIYVCRSGPATLPLANLLYINAGNWRFEERAAEYGLAVEAPSVQAVFFDPDRDGDLDIYLLNHPERPPVIQNAAAYRQDMLAGRLRTDMFLRNEGGRFVDRTIDAGFYNYGYRHGAGVSDLDHDG